MRWWRLADRETNPNKAGERLPKSKRFVKVVPDVVLSNGDIMFCPPGLMPDSLHAVEQDSTAREGRIVLTFRPGTDLQHEVKCKRGFNFSREEKWERAGPGFAVRLQHAEVVTFEGHSLTYPIKSLTSSGGIHGDILAADGTSLIGLEGSREMFAILGIHGTLMAGLQCSQGRVESQVLRYPEGIGKDLGWYVRMEGSGGRDHKSGRLKMNKQAERRNEMFLENMKAGSPVRLIRHHDLGNEWAAKHEGWVRYGGVFMGIGCQRENSKDLPRVYFHLLDLNCAQQGKDLCHEFHRIRSEILACEEPVVCSCCPCCGLAVAQTKV